MENRSKTVYTSERASSIATVNNQEWAFSPNRFGVTPSEAEQIEGVTPNEYASTSAKVEGVTLQVAEV
jgi:hypothetical protein